jgi:hypothetical protein
LFLFLLATQLSAQPAADPQKEAAKLLSEADKLEFQAEELRTKALSIEGEIKKMMTDEAVNFEKEAMRKRVTAGNLRYSILRKRVVENDTRIQKILAAVAAAKHKSHTQFLVDDYRKNMKSADDLYRESQASTNLAAQLGSIENANDKITSALQQQEDIYLMLKEEHEARKVASAR